MHPMAVAMGTPIAPMLLIMAALAPMALPEAMLHHMPGIMELMAAAFMVDIAAMGGL